tara:strand:+ start:77720 stop:78889 length:1170 start_codon:yes stop_codon:yes gene_type:complete
MKRAIFYLIVLIFAVWLGLVIKQDPAYVIIVLKQWTLQTPLWFAVVVVVVALLALYLVANVLYFGGSVGGRLHRWSNKRTKKKAAKQTSRGLIDLAEGNWARSEKLLLKSLEHVSEPLVNYLALAEAAQAQHAYDRRDEYLHKAHDIEPDAEVAVGLTQAQLQFRHKQYEQALATLSHLRSIAPQHTFVLKLLMRIYLKLEDWHNLSTLLPELKRHYVCMAEQLQSLTETVYLGLIQKSTSLESLQLQWQQVPQSLKKSTDMVEVYARQLISFTALSDAEAFIHHQLKRDWCEALVVMYGQLDIDAKAQLATAQTWLQRRPDDAALLFTLGQLTERQQLWGQSRDYFEKCLAIKPAAHVYSALAQLLESLGDTDKANQYYKKGLLFTAN